MSFEWSLVVLVLIYYIGTVVNALTRGRVNTALFSLILMLIGFWMHLLPPDIIQSANLGGLYAILNLTILVNVGTTFNLKELRRQWKLLIVAFCGIAGMGVMVLLVGGFIFGREISIISFPGLLGGAVAINIMHQAAMEKGLINLASLIIMIQAAQGLFGIPLIGNGTRTECVRLLEQYRKGQHQNRPDVTRMEEHPKLIDRIPARYDNPFLQLLLVSFFGAVSAAIASVTGPATRGILGMACVGLLVGILFRQAGLLTRDPLRKSGIMPILMFVMITMMRQSLVNLSFSDFLKYLPPLFGMLILATAGMGICGIVVGRKLGYHRGILTAFLFGCFAGYPLDYQVAMENIHIMAESPDEERYLEDQIIPIVIMGSIVSVSTTSIIVASIFVNLL